MMPIFEAIEKIAVAIALVVACVLGITSYTMVSIKIAILATLVSRFYCSGKTALSDESLYRSFMERDLAS
jgi:hypothetical protein